MRFKAFISYSHAADGQLAPTLQSALHRFAKPFYRRRAIRTFRDQTNLQLTPELWPTIQKALNDSEFFLLLASPEAAQSKWVQAEIKEWLKLSGGSIEKLLIVLTSGEIVWNDSAGDFNWERTTALPACLKRQHKNMPKYSDLRWAKKVTDLSLRHPQFLQEVGVIGATLHGKSIDEMIGADVREHRIFKLVTGSVLSLLLLLLLLISALYYIAKSVLMRLAQTSSF